MVAAGLGLGPAAEAELEDTDKAGQPVAAGVGMEHIVAGGIAGGIAPMSGRADQDPQFGSQSVACRHRPACASSYSTEGFPRKFQRRRRIDRSIWTCR